jgi:hypothetical protein
MIVFKKSRRQNFAKKCFHFISFQYLPNFFIMHTDTVFLPEKQCAAESTAVGEIIVPPHLHGEQTQHEAYVYFSLKNSPFEGEAQPVADLREQP